MARYDKRLEDLSGELIVLKARAGEGKKSPRAAALKSSRTPKVSEDSSSLIPAHLKVVRLTPTEVSDDVQVALGERGGIPVEGGASSRLQVAPLPPSPDFIANERAAIRMFEKGLEVYQKGIYQDAVVLFHEFGRAYPSHPRAGDALFWLGQCHFETHMFARSVKAWEEYLERFPKGIKRADALLNLGLSLERLKKPKRAAVVFRRLVTLFPDTAFAELGRAHLKRGGGS
jgi:tol-pal system protein YbgF